MTEDEMPLEQGLSYYYEMQDEFERRELPIEKQIAISFEAGRQIGRAENMIKNKEDSNG